MASIEPFTDRAGQLGVAGVDGRMGLQEHQVGLRAGERAVPKPSGDHEQLPGAEQDVVAVLQLDAELAGRDEEDFVGLVVLVPHELMELTEMVDTPGLQPGRRPRDRAAAAPDGQATPGDPAPR
jgi:hypothetical protein